jgi:hypothetical protein
MLASGFGDGALFLAGDVFDARHLVVGEPIGEASVRTNATAVSSGSSVLSSVAACRNHVEGGTGCMGLGVTCYLTHPVLPTPLILLEV